MGKRGRVAPSARCLQQPLRTCFDKLRLSGRFYAVAAQNPLRLSLSKPTRGARLKDLR
jgi:hypothetical protein